MRIYELDQQGGMLAKALQSRRAAEAPRTGLHLSTIKEDILRRYRPKRGELPTEQVHLLQETGVGLEEVIAREFRRATPGWIKPKPRTHDGITCSPDGEKARSRTIDEMKVSWARWPGDRDAFFAQLKTIGYVMQIKAYVYVWGYDRARLHVVFLTGTKGGSPLPISKTFLLRFDTDELLVNWEMIRQHAIDIGLLAYHKRRGYYPIAA